MGSRKDLTSPANIARAVAVLSDLIGKAQVLGETGKPMSCQELIAAMVEKGYWASPKGLTPQATLYSGILRELKVKGTEARFQKTARGKFTLRAQA